MSSNTGVARNSPSRSPTEGEDRLKQAQTQLKTKQADLRLAHRDCRAFTLPAREALAAANAEQALLNAMDKPDLVDLARRVTYPWAARNIISTGVRVAAKGLEGFGVGCITFAALSLSDTKGYHLGLGLGGLGLYALPLFATTIKNWNARLSTHVKSTLERISAPGAMSSATEQWRDSQWQRPGLAVTFTDEQEERVREVYKGSFEEWESVVAVASNIAAGLLLDLLRTCSSRTYEHVLLGTAIGGSVASLAISARLNWVRASTIGDIVQFTEEDAAKARGSSSVAATTTPLQIQAGVSAPGHPTPPQANAAASSSQTAAQVQADLTGEIGSAPLDDVDATSDGAATPAEGSASGDTAAPTLPPEFVDLATAYRQNAMSEMPRYKQVERSFDLGAEDEVQQKASHIHLDRLTLFSHLYWVASATALASGIATSAVGMALHPDRSKEETCDGYEAARLFPGAVNLLLATKHLCNLASASIEYPKNLARLGGTLAPHWRAAIQDEKNAQEIRFKHAVAQEKMLDLRSNLAQARFELVASEVQEARSYCDALSHASSPEEGVENPLRTGTPGLLAARVKYEEVTRQVSDFASIQSKLPQLPAPRVVPKASFYEKVVGMFYDIGVRLPTMHFQY